MTTHGCRPSGTAKGKKGGDKGKEKHCNGIPGKEESAEQEHENLKRVANKKNSSAKWPSSPKGHSYVMTSCSEIKSLTWPKR